MKSLQWWNIILWILQVLIAFVFIQSGINKFFNPEELPWPWIKENPGLVKVTAFFDLLGGIGLVLPALIRVQPKLVIYACFGIILLMIMAMIFHISRGENDVIGFNVVVILLTAFVAWGRQKKAVITPRT